MRKYFLTLLFLTFFSLFHDAYGQRVMGALIGGFNATNVQGDDVFGFHKLGLNMGAAAIVPFSESWSFTIEADYTQKGSYHKEGGRGMDYRYRHDYNQYKLVLNYLEVPFMVHFNDKNRLKAGVGFSYGRLIEVKEWEDNVRIATTTLTNGPYDLNDYSALLDLQFAVYKQLKLDARYSFSLSEIRVREYQNISPNEEKIRKQYNQVISLRLIWVFNEKASGNSRLRNGF